MDVVMKKLSDAESLQFWYLPLCQHLSAGTESQKNKFARLLILYPEPI